MKKEITFIVSVLIVCVCILLNNRYELGASTEKGNIRAFRIDKLTGKIHAITHSSSVASFYNLELVE